MSIMTPPQPAIKLRVGWEWLWHGNDEFPWRAAILPGYGKSGERTQVAIVRIRAGTPRTDGIQISAALSRGVEPLDVVLAVVLANAEHGSLCGFMLSQDDDEAEETP